MTDQETNLLFTNLEAMLDLFYDYTASDSTRAIPYYYYGSSDFSSLLRHDPETAMDLAEEAYLFIKATTHIPEDFASALEKTFFAIITEEAYLEDEDLFQGVEGVA